MTQLVLSLFPGIGLLDMAFEQEGFCVVRGPDLLWGGDIRRFHPPDGKFDGVIGGPPCQAFSQLRHMVIANGYQLANNLIPEFERVVNEVLPRWFLMENVRDAPEPRIEAFYHTRSELVKDLWVGGETARVRRFTFGTDTSRWLDRFAVEPVALHATEATQAVLAGASGRPVPVALNPAGQRKATVWQNEAVPSGARFAAACRAQGLPDGFDLPGFTASGKARAIGNGVPLPMGRAVARAVKRALGIQDGGI